MAAAGAGSVGGFDLKEEGAAQMLASLRELLARFSEISRVVKLGVEVKGVPGTAQAIQKELDKAERSAKDRVLECSRLATEALGEASSDRKELTTFVYNIIALAAKFNQIGSSAYSYAVGQCAHSPIFVDSYEYELGSEDQSDAALVESLSSFRRHFQRMPERDWRRECCMNLSELLDHGAARRDMPSVVAEGDELQKQLRSYTLHVLNRVIEIQNTGAPPASGAVSIYRGKINSLSFELNAILKLGKYAFISGTRGGEPGIGFRVRLERILTACREKCVSEIATAMQVGDVGRMRELLDAGSDLVMDHNFLGKMIWSEAVQAQDFTFVAKALQFIAECMTEKELRGFLAYVIQASLDTAENLVELESEDVAKKWLNEVMQLIAILFEVGKGRGGVGLWMFFDTIACILGIPRFDDIHNAEARLLAPLPEGGGVSWEGLVDFMLNELFDPAPPINGEFPRTREASVMLADKVFSRYRPHFELMLAILRMNVICLAGDEEVRGDLRSFFIDARPGVLRDESAIIVAKVVLLLAGFSPSETMVGVPRGLIEGSVMEKAVPRHAWSLRSPALIFWLAAQEVRHNGVSPSSSALEAYQRSIVP